MLNVRGIITGRDPTGAAVVVRDEQISVVSRQVKAGITGGEMCSADWIPVDDSKATLDPQRAASWVASTRTTMSATAKAPLSGSLCSRRDKPASRIGPNRSTMRSFSPARSTWNWTKVAQWLSNEARHMHGSTPMIRPQDPLFS